MNLNLGNPLETICCEIEVGINEILRLDHKLVLFQNVDVLQNLDQVIMYDDMIGFLFFIERVEMKISFLVNLFFQQNIMKLFTHVHFDGIACPFAEAETLTKFSTDFLRVCDVRRLILRRITVKPFFVFLNIEQTTMFAIKT